MAPETRYTKSGDIHIAYSVFGDGPIDVLYVPSWISAIEHYWDEPSVARYFTRLSSFSRLIMFDRRGSGMSDPLTTPPTLEEQMDDIVAVLDAAGSERAAVFALLEGGALAALFAATHPERTSALVLYEGQPMMSWAPDYDWAMKREDRIAWVQSGGFDNWGDGSRILNLSPDNGADQRLLAWYGRLERLAASPGFAKRLFLMNAETDVRVALPSVQAPTLIMHRTDDPFIDIRHSRYLAEHIPGAKLVELPGSSALNFGGGEGTELEEIEEFLTGARHHDDTERILATVMFSDIVDSTRLAAEIGDKRWRDMLESLEGSVGRELMRYRGKPIKKMGDGFLATFDGPARAIRCATAIRDVAGKTFGLQVRSGLHTGEIELVGDDVAGIAVNIGARVEAAARPGEVLVSGTVKDLVAGSGITFEDRGEHELKGVPDRWRLYAVA
jgi:class 3 adenylate cyclase/pimeloyl-ACP methyl ester carboxylesterase